MERAHGRHTDALSERSAAHVYERRCLLFIALPSPAFAPGPVLVIAELNGHVLTLAHSPPYLSGARRIATRNKYDKYTVIEHGALCMQSRGRGTRPTSRLNRANLLNHHFFALFWAMVAATRSAMSAHPVLYSLAEMRFVGKDAMLPKRFLRP